MKGIIPSPGALVRETLVVLGGAILAAFVMHQFPALRAYVRDAMSLTPNP